MVDITIEAEIEVKCDCGQVLAADWKDASYRQGPYLEVEPCKRCRDESHEEGFAEGEASVE